MSNTGSHFYIVFQFILKHCILIDYIEFEWKLNTSCIMSCGNKLAYTCFSVYRMLLHYYILQVLSGGKKN